jgi:hypothetical protein
MPIETAVELVRRRRHELLVEPEDVPDLGPWVAEPAGEHRADRVQAVGERGDDPEVATAAAQSPDQVRMRLRSYLQQVAVGGDQLGLDEVVAGQAVPTVQPAQAAAQCEPGDTGHRHDAERSGQTVLLRSAVEFAKGQAGARAGRAPVRVDLEPLERGQVEHHAAVAHGVAGNAVPAATDREDEVVLPGEGDPAGHVIGAPALDHGGRSPVDHPVEDGTDTVVVAVLRADEAAPQPGTEGVERCPVHGRGERHGGGLPSANRAGPPSLGGCPNRRLSAD